MAELAVLRCCHLAGAGRLARLGLVGLLSFISSPGQRQAAQTVSELFAARRAAVEEPLLERVGSSFTTGMVSQALSQCRALRRFPPTMDLVADNGIIRPVLQCLNRRTRQELCGSLQSAGWRLSHGAPKAPTHQRTQRAVVVPWRRRRPRRPVDLLSKIQRAWR